MKRFTMSVLTILSLSNILQSYEINNEHYLDFGLGTTLNNVTFHQLLNGNATSNVYSGDTLTAKGNAGGPANPLNTSALTITPLIQLSYTYHKEDSHWFGGLKFAYRYLGVTLSENKIDSFQTGQFTTISGSSTFIGNAVLGSSQTNLRTELSFVPFAGYSCTENIDFYLGVNPVVIDTETNLYQLFCFADINGTHSDIAGNPINFFDSQWIWGGAGEIGMNYHLNDRWSINLQYKFAVTKQFTVNNTSEFSGIIFENDAQYTTTGIIYLTNTIQSFIQTIGLTFTVSF